MRRLIMTSLRLRGRDCCSRRWRWRSPGIDMQLDRNAAIRARPIAAISIAGRTDAALGRGRQMRRRARPQRPAWPWSAHRIGSDDASDAARRLDPIFAGCLAGSGAPGPSSVVLRRAALADALGIALLARLT